jgi:hypothetical protein
LHDSISYDDSDLTNKQVVSLDDEQEQELKVEIFLGSKKTKNLSRLEALGAQLKPERGPSSSVTKTKSIGHEEKGILDRAGNKSAHQQQEAKRCHLFFMSKSPVTNHTCQRQQ